MTLCYLIQRGVTTHRYTWYREGIFENHEYMANLKPHLKIFYLINQGPKIVVLWEKTEDEKSSETVPSKLTWTSRTSQYQDHHIHHGHQGHHWDKKLHGRHRHHSIRASVMYVPVHYRHEDIMIITVPSYRYRTVGTVARSRLFWKF
jgi:hypothetical protein